VEQQIASRGACLFHFGGTRRVITVVCTRSLLRHSHGDARTVRW